MTQRADARNDRIATRYMFGENAKVLARAYGIGLTRIRQIVRGHLDHSRRKFFEHFGAWPDELGTKAMRPRLVHLMNQYRVRLNLPPLPPSVLIQRGYGKNWAAKRRLDSPERRAPDPKARELANG